MQLKKDIQRMKTKETFCCRCGSVKNIIETVRFETRAGYVDKSYCSKCLDTVRRQHNYKEIEIKNSQKGK